MNEDLKYSPTRNSGPMTAHRAFSTAELIVYRYRDRAFTPNDDNAAYKILTEAAEQIREVAQTWRKGAVNGPKEGDK
jgi:hypothetical protein